MSVELNSMSDFVHLHNHTEYSLLDGLTKIPDFLAKASEYKMPALAITDHGAMYGAVHFYVQAKKQKINPIIGCEMYIAPRSRYDKDSNLDRFLSHIVLLVENEKGYHNLIQLVTQAHLEGFYYKPRIDLELLSRYHEGLIVLSSCLNGVVMKPLMQEQFAEAEKKALFFTDLFGKGNFFLEIQKHRSEKQEIGNKRMIELAKKLELPLIATNDIHYLNPEDAEAQEVLLCIQTQKTLLDKDRPLSMIDTPDYYFRSPTEMGLLFHDLPEALKNTMRIAERCQLKIPIGKMIMPIFPLPQGESFFSYLKKKSYEGLRERVKEVSNEIQKRMEYELKVIEQKGYSPYFLIVADFVNWAKNQGISVGPGRGSVAGSLVSYSLKITDVNPLDYNIPFERFLNPERPSPPDIDLDFEDVRRDEIISYITKKYGENHVAQVITFGKMEARAAVRDVGRVLGMPYSTPDRIAKLIPQGSSIEEALGQVAELKEAVRETEISRLIKLAKKVEGVSRHASTHAAALVVSDKEITNYVPLTRESKGDRIITQYDMYALDLNISEEAIGLLKFDLLGLRNLTTLSRSVELVKYTQGKEIDLLRISYDDSKVFELISSGETMGVFQMESSGMRRVAKDLKPSRFMDIAALIALYRPGPMELIPQFIAAKHDPSKVKYPHPDLSDILGESYGIPLYQEQVMLIAAKMGGYSLGEADKLRKAMGKKKKSLMKTERARFIKGASQKGYKKDVAEDIFDMMERFAGYGFGKAHSVSYAMIAYQTAYMKVHYPIEFMTALLSAEAHNKDKLSLIINECQRMDIDVLPPDVNSSYKRFSIDGKAIRFGLSGIKNVGKGAIESIIENRQEKRYESLIAFCRRIDLSVMNKRVLESLIKSGACDAFGSRAAQLKILEQILDYTHTKRKDEAKGMMGLFEGTEEIGQTDIKLPEIAEFDRKQILSWEKELLGVYLSEHPLQSVIGELIDKRTHQIGMLDPIEHLNRQVIIGGMITSMRKIFTRKNNSEMAFVKLEDETGSLEVIVFPKVFTESKHVFREDQIVTVKGKVDNKEGTIKILVDEGKLLSESEPISKSELDTSGFLKSSLERRNGHSLLGKELTRQKDNNREALTEVFNINLSANFAREKLVQLYEILHTYPGETTVQLLISNADEDRKIKLPMRVKKCQELQKDIQKILGS